MLLGINFSSVFTVACGGELTAPSGTISSPNYPNLYPHSRVCRWEIIVPTGRRVTLTINDLRLEDVASCIYDYVEVNCPIQFNIFHIFKKVFIHNFCCTKLRCIVYYVL